MNRTATQISWHEANQRYLTVALAELRAMLQHHAPAAGGDGASVLNEPDKPSLRNVDDMLAPPAVERLVHAFGLSAFERNILLMCAGVELEASFAALCADAQGDARKPFPTFGLALAALPDAHWSALAPTSPLRHWRLIDLRTSETLVTSQLRIDERVLHFLTGVQHLDENLIGFVQTVSVADSALVPSHQMLAEEIAAIWTKIGTKSLPAVQLCGSESAGKRAIAASACAMLGLRLYHLPASVVPSGPHEFEALIRLWIRESILSGGALLVEVEDSGGDAESRSALLRRFIEEVDGPLLVATRERVHVPHRPTVVLDIARPTRREQHSLWTNVLGPSAAQLNGHLDRITSQFDLSAPGIYAAGRHALGQAVTSDGEEGIQSPNALWDACRLQARQRLEGLARFVEPTATWDDLVLPEPQLQILREIEAHVRYRLTVYETWGFAARSSRGLGITALFTGSSGTGKTLAAEVLANALRLDLYHIDLSAVVSKYIGETEKNLRRVFDAAEAGGAVLLFDEADALFGKRSEVKDSHDRYANLEVSYLLQKMEAYRGLAVLTTNLKNALDDAFERRLRFRVAFPFPDAVQRAAIWQHIFPPEMPTEGLDVEKLARLNATGGTIRNVALHAAFLAAADDGPVCMAHVRDAAKSVYSQLEKPLADRETRGWA